MSLINLSVSIPPIVSAHQKRLTPFCTCIALIGWDFNLTPEPEEIPGRHLFTRFLMHEHFACLTSKAFEWN